MGGTKVTQAKMLIHENEKWIGVNEYDNSDYCEGNSARGGGSQSHLAKLWQSGFRQNFS